MTFIRSLGLVFCVLLLSASPARAQSWQPLTNQPPFDASNALLLTDGTVMVQQVEAAEWYLLTPDIFGSYVNGTWSQLASFPPDYGPSTTRQVCSRMGG